jgi:RNA polymerase sigma factor (sigma-70 family)
MTRGNAAEAEELTQESFLQLFRKIGTFRGESAFSTWLHRLAFNIVLMRLRKRNYQAVSLDEMFEPGEKTAGLEKYIASRDSRLCGTVDRMDLKRAIEQLPQGYKTVFILHDVQGYEHTKLPRCEAVLWEIRNLNCTRLVHGCANSCRLVCTRKKILCLRALNRFSKQRPLVCSWLPSCRATGNKASQQRVLHSEEELMNTERKLTILATVLAFLTTLPVARASEQDQATKLTFNKAVQIPGRVLPAGTYWFVLAESNTTPNVVQVFNSDRSTLYATVLSVNARTKPADKTTITFADRGSMQPENIVTWFHPGYTTGHEFVYANSEEKELAQVKQHAVVAVEQNQHQKKPTAIGD